MIATILKLIKKRLTDFFWQKGKPGDYKMEEFDWAITVPALWGLRARDMMIEAAYLVIYIIIAYIINYAFHLGWFMY